MAYEDVVGTVLRFQAAMEALAALGARMSTAPDAIPPEIAAAMDDVLAAAGIPSLDDLTPQQRASTAAIVRTAFGQAADVISAPQRQPGWAYTDVDVLEGQGRGSMMVPGLLARAGGFEDVGQFLDVGTGVGWLAVGAAQMWPKAAIVGVDTWQPSLTRARANVEGAGLADRIEIRQQNATELSDTNRFDLTWVPSFYVTPQDLPTVLARALAATRPGGTIAVGRYDPPPDPLAGATMRLRIVRDGGSWLTEAETIDLLTSAGWSDVRPLPKPGPVPLQFVAGRKG